MSQSSALSVVLRKERLLVCGLWGLCVEMGAGYTVWSGMFWVSLHEILMGQVCVLVKSRGWMLDLLQSADVVWSSRQVCTY